MFDLDEVADLQERRKCPSSLSSILALSDLFSGNYANSGSQTFSLKTIHFSSLF